MNSELKFCLIASLLLLSIPMLGLMTSVSGLTLCALLAALISASLAGWPYRTDGFWRTALLCSALPAFLYGLFVLVLLWLRHPHTFNAVDAGAGTDLMLYFLLNGVLVMLAMLVGLLLWQCVLARRPVLEDAQDPATD